MSTASMMAPSDMPERPPREQREWWAVNDDSVQRVTGYSCAPNSPGMWWCPQIGYSCAEGIHLFKTEAEALDKLIVKMETRLTETQEIIGALRQRRAVV